MSSPMTIKPLEAELRANRRRGYNPNSSLDENSTSFLSGVGSSVSSTPSLERAIKKKKIHSESDSDDLSSTQQVAKSSPKLNFFFLLNNPPNKPPPPSKTSEVRFNC